MKKKIFAAGLILTILTNVGVFAQEREQHLGEQGSMPVRQYFEEQGGDPIGLNLEKLRGMTVRQYLEEQGYMPVIQTFEKYGYKVYTEKGKNKGKNGEIEVVTDKYDNFKMTINSHHINFNGGEYLIDAPVILVDGVAYMPPEIIYELGKKSNNSRECFNSFEQLARIFSRNKNYVYSPYGAKVMLAMTEINFDDVYGFRIPYSGDDKDIEKSFDLYTSENQSGNDVMLFASNSLWLNELQPDSGKDVKKEKLKSLYNAEVFRAKPLELGQKAGEWIAEKGKGMQTVFPVEYEEVAKKYINVLYFKGLWKEPFSLYSTYKEEFTDDEGKKSRIDFMHRKGMGKIYSDKNITMVRLDYEGAKNISFYAAMTEKDTIDPVAYVDFVEEKNISLALPTFKCESKINLRKMIDRNMSFMGGFKPEGIAMEQNTIIDVKEWGTEAAAVAVTEAASLDESECIEVKFNKPFRYFIRDNDNGEILFMGEFVSPR